jgi:DNA repair protein RadC
MAIKGKDTLRIDEILSLLIGSGIPNKSALDLSKDSTQYFKIRIAFI